MASRQTIVGVSGSPNRASRTTALVRTIVNRIAIVGDYNHDIIELVDAAPHLFAALTPGQLTGASRAIIAQSSGRTFSWSAPRFIAPRCRAC